MKERQILYRCPRCGEQITRRPDNHSYYTCPRCRTRYLVMIDESTDTTAFVDQTTRPSVLPLHLPKGSVRAVVALTLVGTCAALVARDQLVPSSLGALLLTIIGFYFGFRTKSSSLSDRVYDPSARREQPLYLPAGVIRRLLVIACLAMGAWLIHVDQLLDVPGHLELFVILAGLIVGHYVGRALRGGGAALAHAKGVLAMAMATVLAWVFLMGVHQSLPPYAVMLLCATITFYFGSRS